MGQVQQQHTAVPGVDVGSQPLRRRVLWLALPAVGEQLLNMLVGLTDTYLVGHLGATAVAAVGLSNQLIMLSTTFFSAVAVGATALIARCTGAGDSATANRALSQSLLIGVLMGLAATLLGLLGGYQGLILLGTPAEVLPEAWSYLSIVAASFVLASLTFVGSAALRGAGDTRSPLLVMLLVNGINVILSWGLIRGLWGLPALGVAGSAWGAAIGRGAGGILILLLLLRGRGGLRLTAGGFDTGLARRLLRVGLPAAGEQLIFRFGMLTFNGMITALGTVAYAAHTIGIQAESLSWLPGFGFGIAATTLVGQGLGAGDPREAQRSGYVAYAIGAVFMSSLGVLLVLFPAFFIGVFTDDQAVIDAGTIPLRIMGLAQPVLAATMIFNGALRGAGDTRWVLLANAGGIWAVRLPLTYLMVSIFGWGLEGVWTAMALDQLVRGSLAYLRFRSGKWKTIAV